MIQPFDAKSEKMPSGQSESRIKLSNFPRHLLQSGEIYIILALSAFLHLVNIDKAIFNSDEVDVYSMAHYAITSGWLPLASNKASLGNLNPPLVTYLFMLPAALSANPLWGQILVVLFNIAAILLTYFFTRRYYGRLTGVTASLLYVASVGAWTFSRNIWQQNFLPFFVMLFMFMLFRGVVERRKGWFFWAILLIGIAYQFHGSALYLFIPLAAAVFFGYKTIRWRDVLLGVGVLLVLYAPYIIWEFHVNFVDVTMLFNTAKQQAQIDAEALHFYLFYIHPTLINPYHDVGAFGRDTHLLLPTQTHLSTLLSLIYPLAIVFLLGGILIALWQIFAVSNVSKTHSGKNIVARWWNEFKANPTRQGLALILIWQLGPLLLLTRHSIVLFVHYFIFLLPGQFILMALCPAQLVALVKQFRPSWERLAGYGMAALTILLLLVQLIGIGSSIIDIDAGHFQSAVFSDLSDQQNALQVADQVAQQRHIHRIYLTSFPTYIKMNAMDYLAAQIQTPLSFFTSDNCFMLPAPDAGPVIFLTTSNNVLAETFFQAYANATLVATSPHLGSSPYQIYVVTAKAEPAPVPQTFTQNVQLLSPTVQLLQNQWLTTRWRVVSAHHPAFRTTYGFHLQMNSVAGAPVKDNLNCTPTSTWAGDQLFLFHLSQQGELPPSQVALQAATFVSEPQTLAMGPVKGFTDGFVTTDWQTLTTAAQKTSITLSVQS